MYAAGSARYSIFSGGGPFTVNSLTGQLLTTGQLDRETMSTYLLTVRAQLVAHRSLFTLAQVTYLYLFYFLTFLTRYLQGALKTVEEDSSVFSLNRMH